MAIGRLSLILVLATFAPMAPASAGWREDLGVFRVGIVLPAGSAPQLEGAERIRAGFANALEMPVELFAARDYAVLADAQASGRIQYAIHTATSYASAWLLCSCVEPLVAPVGEDGSTGIRSVLIARPEGPPTPEAAVSAKVAIGPADSVAGRLIPLAEFRPGDTDLSGEESFLAPASSDTEAEASLESGAVAAMFGFTRSNAEGTALGGTPERLSTAGLHGAKVIWTSNLLRNGPHAVRSNLPTEAKAALKSFLTGMRASDPELYELIERRFSGGFVEVRQDDYASAVDLVRRASRPSDEE